MSKRIVITDDQYKYIEAIMLPRETFAGTMARILRVFDVVRSVKDTLGPQHYLMGSKDSFGRQVDGPERR